MPLKTTDVSRLLGCTYWQLFGRIRSGTLPKPPKDSSGDYCWSPKDVAAARKVLRAAERRRQAG